MSIFPFQRIRRLNERELLRQNLGMKIKKVVQGMDYGGTKKSE